MCWLYLCTVLAVSYVSVCCIICKCLLYLMCWLYLLYSVTVSDVLAVSMYVFAVSMYVFAVSMYVLPISSKCLLYLDVGNLLCSVTACIYVQCWLYLMCWLYLWQLYLCKCCLSMIQCLLYLMCWLYL